MNAFARIDKDGFFRFMAKRRHERYEFVKGRIVQQMTGGTRGHGVLGFRIAQMLSSQLDQTLWSVVPERGTETEQTIRYPDVVVEPADEPIDSLTTERPVLIVEVLSPSTSANDLDVKPAEYMSLASLDAYIVVSQTEAACLVWARRPDGAFTREPREIAGAGAVIELSCRAGPLRLALDEIYRGLLKT